MASTSLIDLGDLRLQCTDASFALALTNSARITPTNPDHSGPAAAISDLTALNAAWVSHGPNTILLLDIAFTNHVPSPEFMLNIRDRLTASLNEAPLWPQLHLIPSLAIIASTLEHEMDRIAVTLSRTCSTSNHISSHRLGAEVPSSDIKPPFGVSQFSINEIHLNITISSEDDDMHNVLADPFSSTEMVSHIPLERKNLAHEHLDKIHSLFIAALRCTISRSAIRKSSGIVISEVSSFKCLEDIFPVNWNVDYVSVL